jgi:RecB family exonuclease
VTQLAFSLGSPPPAAAARLRVAPYGPGADEALAAMLATIKADDPLAPVTVAVPSTVAGLSIRRRFAYRTLSGSAPGLVNVRFLVLARVAELLGAPRLAAAGRQPLNHAVRMQAVRSIAAQNPGRLAPVLEHPDTLLALDATMRDLRRTPADALPRLATASRGAAHAVDLYRALRALTTRAWYDDDDLAEAAAAAVTARDSALADVGTVVLHLPRRLTPSHVQLATALAGAGLLAAIIGVTGDGVADESAEHLVTALVPLLGDPDRPGESLHRPNATRVVRAIDPDDEVRAAVRSVAARLEADVPLHEMAIVWRAHDPYALLVEEQLAAAGIPFSGAAARSLSQTLAGRTLLGALTLPDDGFTRRDVFAWLSGAPVLLQRGRRFLVPTTRFEDLAREAGIVRGAADWEPRLAGLEQRKREELSALEDDPDERAEWRSRRLERDLDALAQLQVFVRELLTRLTPPETVSWNTLSRWARGLLDRYLGTPGADWPDDEVAAFEAVAARIDALASLDAIAGPGGIREFRIAVEQELSVPAGRHGRAGDGVFTGRLADVAGMRFQCIFVLGASDGSFPPPVADDPLLPDRVRRQAGDHVPVRADARADERRDWLAALASATERVVSIPRSDPRAQRIRLPARWLLDEVSFLAGGIPVGADDLEHLGVHDWFDDVPSYEAGLRRRTGDGERPFPSLHERDLAELLRAHDRDHGARAVAHHPLVVADARFASGFAAHRGRTATTVTRWSGASGGDVRGIRDEWSPSRLQTLARCPFQFFLASVLRVAEPADPEPVEIISAIDRGNLVHACLERFVGERIDDPPDPGARWTASDHARLREIAREEFARTERKGLTGRPLLWRLEQERLLADLEQTLLRDDERRSACGLVPAAVELEFGGDEFPVRVPLTNGTEVRFRGRIDRVDRSHRDGAEALAVVDYKTGRANDYREIRSDPVARGTQLQLPVYALGARARLGDAPVRADFWFVTARGDYQLIGFDVADEHLDRLRSVLDVLDELLAHGQFPARPGSFQWDTHANCRYCPYTRVCPPERGRRWDRMRTDPSLGAYVALAGDDDGNGGDE